MNNQTEIKTYKKDLERFVQLSEESICRAERLQNAKEKSLKRCKELLNLFRFAITPSKKYELVLIYKDDLEKVKPNCILGDYFLKFLIERAQNETGIKRLSRSRANEIVNSIAI